MFDFVQVIRSPECVLNGVSLDPFYERQKQTKSEMKSQIFIMLMFDVA